MLGLSYCSMYNSCVTVKYLIQISTGVSRHLQLFNVKTFFYKFQTPSHCPHNCFPVLLVTILSEIWTLDFIFLFWFPFFILLYFHLYFLFLFLLGLGVSIISWSHCHRLAWLGVTHWSHVTCHCHSHSYTTIYHNRRV